jgi:hypothetical protein
VIKDQVAKAEASVADFWGLWKSRNTGAAAVQVPPDVWFDHFSKILQSNTPPEFPDVLDDAVDNSLDNDISTFEILTAIRHGKAGKAAGPDGLTFDVLKDCEDIFVLPLQYIVDYCFQKGCCPTPWLCSYLLPIYKGKGPLSVPDSYRGVALLSCALKCYTYILNRRILSWAEGLNLLPHQQHGFRSGRSTGSAIEELNSCIHDALSSPKTPLYVAFIDFRKAFDSIDRSLLLRKLSDMGLSNKMLRAIWAVISVNYIEILSNGALSEKVSQTLGLAQGECLSPLLYILFTFDLPSCIEAIGNCITLLYADDLAICSKDASSLQAALDRLSVYCNQNLLTVNTDKSKIVKFRRGGRLCKSDVMLYEGNKIEFVTSFSYLGVVLMTKGGLSGHLDHLKKKGISACARMAICMPLARMSLESLERLFLSVIVPSATYGIPSLASNLTEGDFEFLTTVQCRLLKFWWGISKFASSSHILEASGWLAVGPLLRAHYCENAPIPAISSPGMIHSPAADLIGPRRKVWGRWIGTAFHSLWCSKRACFHLAHDCKCRLCGSDAGLRREHLVHCKWVLADSVGFDAIELLKLETVLYATRPSQ